LKFIRLNPNLNKVEFLEKYGRNIYNEDSDFCCDFNKVNPLNNYLEREGIEIWYAAIRKSQSAFRKTLNQREKLRDNLLKVHPLLYWTESDIDNYIRANSLPSHPLQKHGYESIGCYPCTKIGINRSGRWQKSVKTECGLHFKKSNIT
jgi:phosphoadenosine phosphosulfate reductase